MTMKDERSQEPESLTGRPPLTCRQREYYDFIGWYMRRHGVAPFQHEIAKHFGIQKGPVRDALTRMERRGAVRLLPRQPRGIILLAGNAPLSETAQRPLLGANGVYTAKELGCMLRAAANTLWRWLGFGRQQGVKG